MAPEYTQTTVAASGMPFLRESVNAARGRTIGAAKVGNATSIWEVPDAAKIAGGRRSAAPGFEGHVWGHDGAATK